MSKKKIPYSLLALDLVGALLVAVGIMNRLSDQPSFEGIAYVVVGFFLMAPLIVHLLRR